MMENSKDSMVNNSSMIYQGQATVKFMKGKDIVKVKTIHNNGTSLLFTLLSQCLIGIDVTKSMPKYLDIGNYMGESEGSGKTFTSYLTNRVSLTARLIRGVNIESNSGYAPVAASFTAFVPSRTVSQDILQGGGKINCLRLYNLYDNTVVEEGLLAQIELSNDEVIQSSDYSKYSMMIEWLMTFSNVVRRGESGTEGDNNV